MRVLCAPDSYKGSLTATEAATAMRLGVLDAAPDAEVDACPIADGGEGTVNALVMAGNGQVCSQTVCGPRGNCVEAEWARLPGDRAAIELAAASGLTLLPEDERDPEATSTFGTGELMGAALRCHAKLFVLGLGGSATNDAGCGLVQALGGRFLDAAGRAIDTPITGGDLRRIASIDLTGVVLHASHTPIRVACDVANPLTGPDGAAHVYAPQKGASPDAVARLDAGLRHVASLWRDQFGVDVEALPGAGAAGGVGGGLVAMLGATLEPGIALVLDAVGFDDRVASCDLCLTGEGRLDGQSLSGKAVLGVAHAAAERGVPTHALVGSLGDDDDRAIAAGLAGVRVIAAGVPRARAMRDAAALLRGATAGWIRELGG